jgi:hypothetical protein
MFLDLKDISIMIISFNNNNHKFNVVIVDNGKQLIKIHAKNTVVKSLFYVHISISNARNQRRNLSKN